MDVRTDELECSPIEFIRTYLSDAVLYEQLAEEAAELSQAALKCARVLRGENPTPMNFEEARINLVDEYNDVSLVADILWVAPDEGRKVFKQQRWVNRILAKINKENEGEN